jgi:hypothetical protein
VQLRYGSAFFPANQTVVTTRKDGLPDAAGNIVAYRAAFDVDCTLLASTANGQAELTALCVVFERALAVPGRDLVFLRDDGGVAMSLPNATSYTGVRVTRGPYYQHGDGAELSSYRTFSFTAEAEYALSVGNVLVSYVETLETWGGGPEYFMLEPINGPAIKQLVKESAAYYARQTGQAVGLTGYPVPPAPIWPGAMMRARRIRRSSASRVGRTFRDYPIAWEYEFGSSRTLTGDPTAWR